MRRTHVHTRTPTMPYAHTHTRARARALSACRPLFQGAVFKRTDKSGLFQLACADMRERFQYLCVLCLIAVSVAAPCHRPPWPETERRCKCVRQALTHTHAHTHTHARTQCFQVRNMAGYGWDVGYFAENLIWTLLIAFSSEVFVDIFKNTFLTRCAHKDTDKETAEREKQRERERETQ